MKIFKTIKLILFVFASVFFTNSLMSMNLQINEYDCCRKCGKVFVPGEGSEALVVPEGDRIFHEKCFFKKNCDYWVYRVKNMGDGNIKIRQFKLCRYS